MRLLLGYIFFCLSFSSFSQNSDVSLDLVDDSMFIISVNGGIEFTGTYIIDSKYIYLKEDGRLIPNGAFVTCDSSASLSDSITIKTEISIINASSAVYSDDMLYRVNGKEYHALNDIISGYHDLHQIVIASDPKSQYIIELPEYFAKFNVDCANTQTIYINLNCSHSSYEKEIKDYVPKKIRVGNKKYRIKLSGTN